MQLARAVKINHFCHSQFSNARITRHGTSRLVGSRPSVRISIGPYRGMHSRTSCSSPSLSSTAGVDVNEVLNRPWLLPAAAATIHQIRLAEDSTHLHLRPHIETNQLETSHDRSDSGAAPDATADATVVYVIRDDLLHPVMGGNKLRKLDALIPQLEARGATDVLTCGGVQSAHTVAVAAACAERGLRAHLLLRGEPLKIPTGYALMAGMYGAVTYVPRQEYADREAMFAKHAARIAREHAARGPPDCHLEVIREGAAQGEALLGLVRLVKHLVDSAALGDAESTRVTIVVDSGTGTTAVGLALGIALMGVKWEVVGVMLAGDEEYYRACQAEQIAAAATTFASPSLGALELPLRWVDRPTPRRFGRVLPGDIEECRDVARATGMLLDPIYTLAGWEVAATLAAAPEKAQERVGCAEGVSREAEKVVFLHTGGTLGLFGLGQRYPNDFT